MNAKHSAVPVKLTSALVGAFMWAAVAQAADYCCLCKDQTAGKTIDASNRGMAIAQCSLECGGFTNVTSGKCAAAAPAAAPPAASSGVVLVFGSEDCSGDSARVTSSTPRLGERPGRSFRVESGAPASAWEKADYTGRHTELVAPSICVSPGFDIQSIKLK
jgi:hypothetical protein